MLIILHEKSGADYLASTGRSLAAPGHVRSYVLMKRFELAGWSQDPNGRFDPAGIDRVSIGWGGYFGKEGETVEFSLALPEVTRPAR